MSYQITSKKILLPEEHKHLLTVLKTASDRDALMLKAALQTGARANELLKFCKADLEPSEQTIYIHGLKGSHDRVIPLKPETFRGLQALAESNESGLCFNIGYDRLVDIWHMYRPVPKKFHSCRHFFAVELYKKCRDIKIVQQALGHKSIVNTLVYLDYVNGTDQLRKALL